MTEAEWLACGEPHTMVSFLIRPTPTRLLRLFACACIRRFWATIRDERVTRAVEVAERFADKKVRSNRRGPFIGDVFRATEDAGGDRGSAAFLLAVAAHDAICDYQNHPEWRPHLHCSQVAALAGPEAATAEMAWQCAALRDLAGNPFRPARLDSGLLTPTVLALARTAEKERRLPEGLLDDATLGVLGDALEDAGCTDAAVLTHLREPGPHVKGCWVLDEVLRRRPRR